jgi:hypothetical protein
LLQLAAHADVLAGSGVPVAPEAELELGDGTVVRYSVGDLIPVYRSQRAVLERLLDEHYATGAPVRWDNEEGQSRGHYARTSAFKSDFGKLEWVDFIFGNIAETVGY